MRHLKEKRKNKRKNIYSTPLFPLPPSKCYNTREGNRDSPTLIHVSLSRLAFTKIQLFRRRLCGLRNSPNEQCCGNCAVEVTETQHIVETLLLTRVLLEVPSVRLKLTKISEMRTHYECLSQWNGNPIECYFGNLS